MCVHVYMYICAEKYEEEKYLWWNHTATHDKDVWPSQGSKLFDKLRNEGFVTSSKCADAHRMHICVHSLLGDFTGGLSTQEVETGKGLSPLLGKALGFFPQRSTIIPDCHFPVPHHHI